MHIIVAYDISNDRRRDRVRKALLQFGNPVQKSVFECDLTHRQIQKMTRIIRSIMSSPADNVRYYQLCKGCARAVETFGGKPIEKTEAVYII